jgi:hypothetical protein
MKPGWEAAKVTEQLAKLVTPLACPPLHI